MLLSFCEVTLTRAAEKQTQNKKQLILRRISDLRQLNMEKHDKLCKLKKGGLVVRNKQEHSCCF